MSPKIDCALQHPIALPEQTTILLMENTIAANLEECMTIANIRPGNEVVGTFVVAESKTAEARTGKQYLRILLRDTQGESILGFFFAAPDDILKTDFAGKTVEVVGKAGEYQGSMNLKLTSLSLSAEQWNPVDSLPRSPIPGEQMNADLNQYVEGITDPEIAAVVWEVLQDDQIASKLSDWPAAKSRHHATIGGLLQHILELLKLSIVVAEIYPAINKDLLVAGCILHDIGKIIELGVGNDFHYTPEGTMVGHIVLGDEMVNRACLSQTCSPETTLRLRHMVLSHHGEKEWGAPVVPSTAEAMALHHLDQISSQVTQVVQAIDRSTTGSGNTDLSAWDRQWNRTWFIGKTGTVSRNKAH